MKIYVITTEDEKGEQEFETCLRSCEKFTGLEVVMVPATKPEEVNQWMKENFVSWNYPMANREEFGSVQPIADWSTGLTKHPYLTETPEKRIACFISHYKLWKEAAFNHEPMVVLEQDAIFVRKLNTEILEKTKFKVVGLNDPRGATRKSQVFHEKVQSPSNMGFNIVPVPSVDDQNVPQGLAGNSAYYLTPEGGSILVNLVAEHGAWPNDAIMCKQLMPNQLGVTTKYYTTVQRTTSTTTL